MRSVELPVLFYKTEVHGVKSQLCFHWAETMPGQFLTDSERERLASFPEDIPENIIIQFITLSHTDNLLISDLRRDHNKFGFFIQLCASRYLGFCLEKLTKTPTPILEYVAKQINVPTSIELLRIYGDREQTRTDHLKKNL